MLSPRGGEIFYKPYSFCFHIAMTKDKDSKLSPEDLALFRAAMKNVRPLAKRNQVIVESQRPTLHPHSRISHTSNDILPQVHLSDGGMEPTYADSVLFFMHHSLEPRRVKQWRSGRIPFDAQLDLHHCNIEKARTALQTFLRQCIENKYRHVLIIHGKGRNTTQVATLKSYINHWLPQFNNVLAFCSAQPKNGGTGAVSILLKKQQLR